MFTMVIIFYLTGKRLKIKCDETKPVCLFCQKNGSVCDYSLKLSWGGRPYKTPRVEKTTSYMTITTARMTKDALSDAVTTQLKFPQNLLQQATDQPYPQAPSRNIENCLFQESPLQKPVDTESFIMETPRVHYLPADFRPRFTMDVTKPTTQVTTAKPAHHVKPLSTPPINTPAITHREREAPATQKTPEKSPSTALRSNFSSPESDFAKDISSPCSYESADAAGAVAAFSYRPYNSHSAFIKMPLRNLVSTRGDSSPESCPSFYDTPDFGSSPSPRSESISKDKNIGVAVDSIPRPLHALPDILRRVPLYRELFHHFVYVTADLLVPAPTLYPQNPFKVLLPSMSLATPHLLDLILAYSATHRAHLLKVNQPYNLITRLLGRVFKGLTRALESGYEAQSDATLTTAIMLASYEIYSGDVHDAWKKHLHGARDIVMARGLTNHILAPPEPMASLSSSFSLSSWPATVSTCSERIIGPSSISIDTSKKESDVAYFLIRWFSYIDVIGGLSSARATTFMTRNENMAQLWALHNISISRLRERSVEEEVLSTKLIPTVGEGKIDFMLGVDLEMLPVFSKVTYLVRQKRLLLGEDKENEKQRETTHNNNERFNEDRHEGYDNDDENDSHLAERYARLAQINTEAHELINLITSFCEAYELRRKQYMTTACHPDSTYSQLCIMNTTFCFAVILQIYRRVLNLPCTDSKVQNLVSTITALLDTHIPEGSDVESCMSFPIFVTACEVIEPTARKRFWIRMKNMERFGAGHVIKAREIMEICWSKNQSWVDVMEENGWDLVLA